MQNRYDSRQQRFKDWLRSSRNKKDAPRKRKHKLSGCNDAGKKGDRTDISSFERTHFFTI
jgi:hypothetical protein